MLGRKRHILTDTLGLLLAVSVHPASVQDRDGAEALLREARRSFPFLERIIGDAGYQGRKMETAVARTGNLGTTDRSPLRPAPLHCAPETLDRGADTGMDQPLSPLGSGLRASRPQSRRVRPPRHGPPHAAPRRGKQLITNPNFPERHLVELALSSSKLPQGSPVEKRDVELQRLQFALKASLRAKRQVEAAKLALKAGEETAGDARQQKLLQDNTDLASVLIEPARLQEIVSRRVFGEGQWVGAHHVYEAGLLSSVPEFRGEARSRLRMAYEWLRNWGHRSDEERQREPVEDNDIAEMAVVRLNLDGAAACASELRRWKPREVSYRAGRTLARRLIDHGRYDELDQVAVEATNDLCLILAINVELRSVHRTPPREAVERALRLVVSTRVKIESRAFDYEQSALSAVTALVESAYLYGLRCKDVLASVLDRYLPDSPSSGLTSRFSKQRFPLLRAYTLQAALKDEPLELIDLARPELQSHFKAEGTPSEPREVRELKEDVGALLPWHRLRAASFLSADGSPFDVESGITAAHQAASRAARISYREKTFTSDEIAQLWFDIIVENSVTDEAILGEFQQWFTSLKRPLFTPTLSGLARLAARTTNFREHAYGFAQRAFEITKNAREDAESKAQTYVELARAMLAADRAEAGEYFNRAVEVASKLGDEIIDRWQAILDLADRASDPSKPGPEMAYRLARCAELAYKYFYRDKHYDWEGTVTAVAGLCPSSCLAILSRWRDRDFGDHQRLLPTAVHCLLERRAIDPKAAIALITLRASWNDSALLERVIEACSREDDKKDILNYYISYIRFDEQSLSAWEALKRIATANQLEIPPVDQLIEFTSRREAAVKLASRPDSFGNADSASVEKEKDWDAIFGDLELHTADGISNAYANLRSQHPPFHRESFYRELFKRVIPGKETNVVRAFSDVAEFDLYEFRGFLDQLPSAWKARMAVKSALAETVKRELQRHCMAITKSRYYQVLPLQTLSDLSGEPEGDLIDIVLAAVGRSHRNCRIRTIVYSCQAAGLRRLSHSEALDALDYGLGLFDDLLVPFREVWVRDQLLATTRRSMRRTMARRTNAAALRA